MVGAGLPYFGDRPGWVKVYGTRGYMAGCQTTCGFLVGRLGGGLISQMELELLSALAPRPGAVTLWRLFVPE